MIFFAVLCVFIPADIFQKKVALGSGRVFGGLLKEPGL
jgi:hypothetical protein